MISDYWFVKSVNLIRQTTWLATLSKSTLGSCCFSSTCHLCNDHVSWQIFCACVLRALYLSQSCAWFHFVALLNQRLFRRLMCRISLLIQDCVNLCEVVWDGTLSSIILSHPSLKNDQPSLCKLVDDELESSSHISFILWVFALCKISVLRATDLKILGRVGTHIFFLEKI